MTIKKSMPKGTINKKVFIFIGANFFMQYLLPTNPSSKNILFSFLHKKVFGVKCFCKDIDERIEVGYVLYFLHLTLGILYFIVGMYNGDLEFAFIWNLFFNIYPCIIQWFIVRRCERLIKFRNYKLSFLVA